MSERLGENSPRTADLLADWRARLERAETVRADLYLRSLGAPVPSQERQEAVLERLEGLEATGRIDTWTVNVWGDRLYTDGRCSETPVGRHLTGKLSEFDRWAGDHEAVAFDLDAGVVDCGITGTCYEMIRLPRLALAVYADSELVAVVPCEVAGASLSVSSFLEEVVAGPDRSETSENEGATVG